MLRLESERQARDEALRIKGKEILDAQRKAMRSVAAALAEDQRDLRQLGIALINPETGSEIVPNDPSLRGVTITDLTQCRFADVTLEYHVDTHSFSLVEWRGRETPEPGANPFERQRANFNNETECLQWLANFLFDHIDLDASPWGAGSRMMRVG
jgi:hypothetical protein